MAEGLGAPQGNSLTRFFGMEIFVDKTLPPNVVEFRDSEGKVLKWFLESGGTWFEIDSPSKLQEKMKREFLSQRR